MTLPAPAESAVLVAVWLGGFEHQAAHHGLATSVAWAERLTSSLRVAVAEAGGEVLGGVGPLLVGRLPDATSALRVALPFGHAAGVSAAVLTGELVPSAAGPQGSVLAQLCRLAMFAGNDLLVDKVSLLAATLPEGVGSFRAPEHLESHGGGPLYVLFDGR